ncbi:MAG: poly-gamma-glutamate system protein [Polyangiaceae bacterium]
MKRVYWRPPGVSRSALAMIALAAIAALVVVERFPVVRKQAYYAEKMRAARLSYDAMRAVKAERVKRGLVMDAESDPHQTGLIGFPITPITSNTGYISAKRASTNPNFAAVILHYLKRAGVEHGDRVAVGVSGSFPALSISAYAALQVLEAQPLVVASVSGSEWGANDPAYTWLDMERTLYDEKLFSHRSLAASRGGIDDRGMGMSKDGRALIDAAIARNNVERIDSTSLVDAIERRMAIYDARAGDKPIKAYINVGGGSASVGTHVGKKQFRPGLNLEPPRGEGIVDSVMLRFAERGIPVVHVSNIAEIAKSNGLKADSDANPRIGEGSVFIKAEPNRILAGIGVGLILMVMLAFIRLDVGLRILRTRKKEGVKQPQQMV